MSDCGARVPLSSWLCLFRPGGCWRRRSPLWYCCPRQQVPIKQKPSTGELVGPCCLQCPNTLIYSLTRWVRNAVLTDWEEYCPSPGRGAKSGAANSVPVVEDGWLRAGEAGAQGHTELPWGGPTSLAKARCMRAEGNLCWQPWGAAGTRADREVQPASQMRNA